MGALTAAFAVLMYLAVAPIRALGREVMVGVRED